MPELDANELRALKDERARVDSVISGMKEETNKKKRKIEAAAEKEKKRLAIEQQLQQAKDCAAAEKEKKRLAIEQQLQQAKERSAFFSNLQQYETYEVAVPQGVAPGSQFPVLIDGRSIILTCPADFQEGMKVLFRLPRKPS